MINDKTLKQEGAENSTNFQSQNVNIYNGINYSDAKAIFQDLFTTNFIILKSEAAQIAQQRAEEITDKFLGKLQEKSPESIQQFQEPALQDALFTTQKEYAKSGDSDLGDLLVDILVDRAQSTSRNMLQLVLDEALKIAPSLTIEQLDTLTLNFILTRVNNNGVIDFEALRTMVKRDIEPFAQNLRHENSHFGYLEYKGCGYVRQGDYGNLAENWRRKYQGLYVNPITKERIEEVLEGTNQYPSLIIPCLRNMAFYQVNALNESSLLYSMEELGVPNNLKPKYIDLFNERVMTLDDVKYTLIRESNCFEKVFDVWDNSRFKKFELSSVGIAIAHANYRRKTGRTMNLSLWID